MDKIKAYLIWYVHVLVILINTICIPLLAIYQPFYVSVPLITLICSPLVGGTYCLLYMFENYYRQKAGMPIRLIPDPREFKFRPTREEKI